MSIATQHPSGIAQKAQAKLINTIQITKNVNFVEQAHTGIAQKAQAKPIGTGRELISVDIAAALHQGTVLKAHIKTTKSKTLRTA